METNGVRIQGRDKRERDRCDEGACALPGLDIEIVHRRSREGDAEETSINLQAVPSFEVFGRFLEQANPFALWMEAARLAWLPGSQPRAP